MITTLVILHGLALAQDTPGIALTAGQTGRIVFETTTLNDSQFLKGEKSGPNATIWGDLRLPQRSTGRIPVVVIIQGTVGVGPREERWAEELNSLGVATFVIDSRPDAHLAGDQPKIDARQRRLNLKRFKADGLKLLWKLSCSMQKFLDKPSVKQC